jgi:AcrR family transcriptional regulator
MKKKDLILRAATILFAEKGFKDTSISDLAKATGTAEGTIFYHFKNKEHLFISILKNTKDDILREFNQCLGQMAFGSGLEMLQETVSFYINVVETMENRFLLLHRHDAHELARVNKTCRDHLEALFNSLVDIFERPIVQGQKDRSIRKMPPRKAALIIFAMVDGLARLNTFHLYDAGALYGELGEACCRIVANQHIME